MPFMESSSPVSFFITLIESTDASRRALEAQPKIHRMLHHGLELAEYRAFLHDLYHIVWHFCPIMCAAASRCDESLRAVRYELYERVEEEKGHEQWVLDDIRAMGGDVDAARSRPPSAPVQAMIAFNYWGAERQHACSVLGMLYTLEVVSSVYGGRVADAIARATGRDVEGGGFKFLTSHGSMDQDHMAKLNLLVRKIDDAAAQAAVVNSTQVNFFQFGELFGSAGFASHMAG